MQSKKKYLKLLFIYIHKNFIETIKHLFYFLSILINIIQYNI